MFSPLAIELIANPIYRGELVDATHSGHGGTPGDGPYISLFLICQDSQIIRAQFESNGCPSSVACGGLLTKILLGRTLDQARKITGEDILKILGGLPEGKEYYADMAAQALQNCVR